MDILKKFQINHKSNNGTSQMNIYMVIIFMHAIVSVNTVDLGLKMAETETTTFTKTLFDLSKNPAIAQRFTKTSISTHLPATTKTKTTTSSSSKSSPSSALPLSSTLYSHHLSSETMMTALAAVEEHFKTPRTHDALAAKDVDIGDCKSLTSVWGDVNPNIFYICDTNTKQPLQLRCPEGRGFFMGFGYSGCIPYEDWPACVSVAQLEQVAVCDSEHMQQPWQTMNPNKFYVCLQETIEPTMLNCESGKGFVHAVVNSGEIGGGGTSEIVGCANWEKWRSYMQCNDYY